MTIEYDINNINKTCDLLQGKVLDSDDSSSIMYYLQHNQDQLINTLQINQNQLMNALQGIQTTLTAILNKG